MTDTMLPEGDSTYEVPPGHVAAVETSLERFERPAPDGPRLPEGYRLTAWQEVERARYVDLIRSIGAPWLWSSILELSADDLDAYLTYEERHVFRLEDEVGKAIGIFQTDLQDKGIALEVEFFGLVPEATGKKLGPAMMQAGLEAVWTEKVQRVWLHTCTLDHPAALTFYQRQGFQPFKRRVVVGTDPRLTGHLPRETARHVAIIE